MSQVGVEDDSHQSRHRVGLMVGLVVVAVLIVLALIFSVRALQPDGDRLSLSLYDSDGPGQFSAQVQYACAGDPCGNDDRIFFNIEGKGVREPTGARVGSTEITEAVIREQEGGLLVYFGIPAGEPGYSITHFPCAEPGESLQVEAIVESNDGETRSSASGTVLCPSE